MKPRKTIEEMLADKALGEKTDMDKKKELEAQNALATAAKIEQMREEAERLSTEYNNQRLAELAKDKKAKQDSPKKEDLQ